MMYLRKPDIEVALRICGTFISGESQGECRFVE